MSLVRRLPFLDRYLTLWVLLAMVGGVALGKSFSGASAWLGQLSYGAASLPIAIGLIVMLFPPFARVRYEELPQVMKDWKVFVFSLIQNWVVGPLLMFGLAVLFLQDQPEYMTGLILVGLARGIARIAVWNQLAEGSDEVAGALVAFNSLFQLIFLSVYAWFFLAVLPGWCGLADSMVHVGFLDVAQSVGIYLGIPFVVGCLVRRVAKATRGQAWLEGVFLPKVAPLALIMLLFAIVAMFTLQGAQVIARPVDVLHIAVPLTIYSVVMFVVSFLMGKVIGADYAKTTSVAFIAASNHFELSIVIAIATFGLGSAVSFATAIGPLIEVPVLISLVGVAFWLRKKVF